METVETPATRPPSAGPSVATFDEQVANLAAPRTWLLHAWPENDEPSDDPVVTATLPVPEGIELATHLAIAGATVGRWRVVLVPTVKKQAARHRLDRLQRVGPVSGIVIVDQEHVDDARELKPSRRAARTSGRTEDAAAERSPSVKALRVEVEMQRATNERAQLLLESKRIEKQLRDLDAGEPKPVSGFAGVAQFVAPFVPLVVEAVRGFIQTQQQTAAALAEALTREPNHAPQVQLPPPGITLETVLALVPQLKDLAKLVGGLGGAARSDDDEPRSEIGSMLQTVRDILVGVRSSAPEAPAGELVPVAVPAAPNGTPAPVAARPKKMTPEQMMSLRVHRFLTAVLQEQATTADPSSAADRLFPAIGALPEEFRRLLLTSTNVEALLSGLPKWLPGPMRTHVPNIIRQDQAKQAWLQVFLDTVREIANQAAGEQDDEAPLSEPGDDFGDAG